MSIDTVGNFLTIIRNGVTLGKRTVQVPSSKFNNALSKVLLEEGFIKNFKEIESTPSIKKIEIALKYVNGESVIHELTRLSSPSRRYYSKAKALQPIRGKLGIAIISTNKGLMTDKQAKELSVGGEIVCSVW